jgi:hypothetical protein
LNFGFVDIENKRKCFKRSLNFMKPGDFKFASVLICIIFFQNGSDMETEEGVME